MLFLIVESHAFQKFCIPSALACAYNETLRQVEYEFANIESLIRGVIDPRSKSGKPVDGQFAHIRNAVAVEKDRIKQSFAFRVWDLENDHHRKHYVQYHQHRLVILIDKLFAISKREEKPGIASRISSEAFFIYDQLDDILNSIQRELPEYFSFDVKIPESQKSKAIKTIHEKFEDYKGLLVDKENSIVTICVDHIKLLHAGSDSKTTFRKVSYMILLIESLGNLLKNSGHDVSEDEIHTLLISMNFNSIGYFTHYTKSIQNEISELGSDIERMEKLAFYYKKINQIQPLFGLTYDPNSKGIGSQLSEWILEEVQFLERKRDLSSVHQRVETDLVRKDFKIEFDMSVSQFAFFIKAFIETGVIQNKNISELIRFLSRFVKTKRSENISYESFRMKYYNVENNTKDSVKNLLHNTIGYINSN